MMAEQETATTEGEEQAEGLQEVEDRVLAMAATAGEHESTLRRVMGLPASAPYEPDEYEGGAPYQGGFGIGEGPSVPEGGYLWRMGEDVGVLKLLADEAVDTAEGSKYAVTYALAAGVKKAHSMAKHALGTAGMADTADELREAVPYLYAGVRLLVEAGQVMSDGLGRVRGREQLVAQAPGYDVTIMDSRLQEITDARGEPAPPAPPRGARGQTRVRERGTAANEEAYDTVPDVVFDQVRDGTVQQVSNAITDDGTAYVWLKYPTGYVSIRRDASNIDELIALLKECGVAGKVGPLRRGRGTRSTSAPGEGA